MAKRPVYVPTGDLDHLVDEVFVNFEWNPGFAPVQKKKNIVALHEAALAKGLSPLLEISTKSEELLGQRLSAFSLKIETDVGEISLEAAFQGSKIFKKGGPYTDIYYKNSRDAKKDPRLKESGSLTGFNYFGKEWPLIPETAFYDWLYLSTLRHHQEYLRRLYDYRGFTDIEFNPNKSINCQARTCAVLVSLLKMDSLDKALESQRSFIEIISSCPPNKHHATESRQGTLAL